MAIYKTRELQERLCELSEDGCPYVEISELEAAEGFPVALSFKAVTPDEYIDYDIVSSCELPPEKDFFSFKLTPQDLCHEISFSYEELITIHHAVTNALEYFKECEKDPQTSKDVKRNIKSASVKCRNLQAKLIKFLSPLVVK